MSDNLQIPASRRQFCLLLGRGLGAATLTGVAARVLLGGRPEAEFTQPDGRYGWQIDPSKCSFCGLCESACVRTPSAVKAVNDPIKCSYCVVCYGHISDRNLPSAQIDTQGKRICPRDAVRRENIGGGPEGAFRYSILPERCEGCGRCALQCSLHGSKSMFLIIRPDLCLGCNDCSIARICPSGAIERCPSAPADDFRGERSAQDGTIA